MERINLKLLRALSVLLEQRNVTHAAEQLHLSQSAMSRQLAQLRDYFDDELLVREGSDYLLTALAQQLKPSVQSIVSQVDNLRDETLFEPDKCQRRFTFACTDYVANFIFPDVLSVLQAQAPKIDISYRLWQTEWIDKLGSMPIDFATTMTSEVPENLYGIHLGDDRPVVLMAKQHPLAKSEGVSPEQLLDYAFAKITAGGDKDSFIDQYFAESGQQRRIAYEVPFYTSVFNACSVSELLVIVPQHIAANAERVHPVSWVPLMMNNLPKHDYYLLWHSIHHQDKAHRWLRELIAGVVKDSIFSPQSMQSLHRL